jgi:hypothetical protein
MQSVFLCGWKDTSTKKKLRQRNYWAANQLFSRVIDFGKVNAKNFFYAANLVQNLAPPPR